MTDTKVKLESDYRVLRVDNHCYSYKDTAISQKYKTKFQFACEQRCGALLSC